LLTGLPKYAGQVVRQRGSSPKLQVLNTALMTAQSGLAPEEIRADGEYWGRLVESAVGAHLVNAAASDGIEVFYWRDRNREVDFVVKSGRTITAIEVKSGRRREAFPGMAFPYPRRGRVPYIPPERLRYPDLLISGHPAEPLRLPVAVLFHP
jgi:hypothetical protein